jgi:hypothetical protein
MWVADKKRLSRSVGAAAYVQKEDYISCPDRFWMRFVGT